MPRRICVVTGSRAEYGLLYWVLHDLRADPAFELQIIATGMHLSPAFGYTVRTIEADGFCVSSRVEMLLSSDTAGGTAKSLGLGVIGMSDALAALRPEMVVVLGDRFEILAAVQACLIHNIPVAHIAGGDVTEGAFDESIRHAVTKMSHLHFVTNPRSGQRVRQLGEDPARVHVVGSPGLDHLRRTRLLNRAELEQSLGASLGERNLLVTFHPVTLHPGDDVRQLDELLVSLDAEPTGTVIWLTRPNADPGGNAISAAIDAWAAVRSDHVHVFASLGQLRYLSLMSHCDAVVGNSSSGLYEAPSFGIPTVNIGSRQGGRLAAASVLHCAAERDAITEALRRARSLDCSNVANPYGDGRSAERIVALLRSAPPSHDLLHKSFHCTGDNRG